MLKRIIALLLAFTLVMPNGLTVMAMEASNTDAQSEPANQNNLPESNSAGEVVILSEPEVLYEGTCGDLTWILTDDGKLTVSGEGEPQSDSEGAYPWEAYAEQITALEIGEGITGLSDYIFDNYANLVSVSLPETLLGLGSYAFAWCGSLETVTFKGDLPVMGYDVFYDTYAVIYYYADKEGWDGTDYWDGKFQNSKRRVLDPENGNVYIAVGTLGDGIRWYLGENSKLTICGTGSIAGELPWNNYSDSILELEICEGITEIDSYAFGGKRIRKITLPEGLTRIGEYAFHNLQMLTEIQIPSTVTRIESYAFSSCNNLKYAELPENLEYLGECAFSDCKSLKTLVLPDGVTEIPRSAFDGCRALETVTIPASVTTLGESVFCGCDSLQTITFLGDAPAVNGYWLESGRKMTVYYPAGNGTWTSDKICSMDRDYISWCAKDLENGDIYFGDGTCGEGLSWVLSTSGVLTISGNGSMANYGEFEKPWTHCQDAIREVRIGEGVTYVGNYAFYDCDNLLKVSFPETLQSIGEGAFSNCDGLERIVLPENLTTVNNKAFSNCDNLMQVTVTSNLEYMGEEVLSGCGKLKEVTFLGDAPTFEWWVDQYDAIAYYPAFNETWTDDKLYGGITWRTRDPETGDLWYGCGFIGSGITWILKPDGVLTVTGTGDIPDYDEYGEYSAPWNGLNSEIKEIYVGEGITRIGNRAFMHANVSKVTISKDVASIGDNAFYRYDQIQEIIFLGDAPQFGSSWVNGDYNYGVKAAYYPAMNATWATDVLGNYNSYNVHWYTRDPETKEVLQGMNVCGENLTWVLTMDGVLTITGTGAMKDFEYEAKPWDYRSGDIVEVVIGEGVTHIGSNAFSSSGIKKVTLPDTLETIGNDVFYGTGLTAVDLPDGLTSIGNSAFRDCNDLDRITIPAGVTNIGEYAFHRYEQIEEIVFLGNAPEFGYNWVNSEHGVEAAYYPAMNATWTSDKLSNYNSYNVSWYTRDPESKETLLGMGTFGENLTWVLTVEGVLTITGTGAMPDFGYESKPWSYRSSDIVEIIIGEGVTHIGESAFSYTGVQTVTLPDTLKTIGNDAFYGTGLTAVDLPDGLTSIGNSAFRDCYELDRITIPASVTNIGEYAIHCYEQIKEIVFLGNAPEFGYNWVNGDYGVEAAYYPAMNATWTSEKLSNYSSYNVSWYTRDPETDEVLLGMGTCGENLIWVLTEEGVLIITGTGAMTDFGYDASPWDHRGNEIVEVVIGEGVTHIGDGAFDNNAVQKATLPETLKSIGQYAFAGCGLKEIDLPSQLTTIAYEAFKDCSELARITIPASVTYIGERAFSRYDQIEEIVFLGDAPEFGNFWVNSQYYYSANGVKAAYYPAMNPTWTSEVLTNANTGNVYWYTRDPETNEVLLGMGACGENLTWALNVDGVLTITGTGAMTDFDDIAKPWDYRKDDIVEVRIGEGVTHIGNWAFCDCYNLTKVTLPESLKTIGKRAFQNCAFADIDLPDGLTTIGDNAFEGCGSLDRITIPAKVTYVGEYAFSRWEQMEEIVFLGDVPEFGYRWINREYSSGGVKAAYYPAMNDTWTSEKLTNNNSYDVPWYTIHPDTKEVLLGMGWCGDNLIWFVRQDGTLYIYGEGQMWNYSEEQTAPWYRLREVITRVVIAEEVTSIGNYAFFYSSMSQCIISGELTDVGERAFYYTNSLDSVFFRGNMPTFGVDAFENCNAVCYYPDNNASWTGNLKQVHKFWAKYTPADHVWQAATCLNHTTCTTCGGIKEAPLGHDIVNHAGKEASCTEKGWYAYTTCDRCDYTTYRDMDMLAHTPAEAVKENAETGTCAEGGRYESVVYCTVCEKEISRNLVITEGTLHIEVTVPAVEATCTETGLTEGKRCNVCDKTLVEQEVVPVKSHTPDEPVYEDDVPVVKCKICGEEISRGALIDPFEGANMTLGGKLEMNFFVRINELPASGCYAVVTRHFANGKADEVVTYPQSEWSRFNDTLYFFAYTNLAAKEMTDVMEAVIYDAEGNQISVVRQESIRAYAMRGIAKYENDPAKAESMTMFIDMLNYGAAAQMYFGYHTDDLANALLTEAQKACASADTSAEVNNVKGPGCAGSNLGLENEIQLNFIFEKAKVTEGMYAVITYTDHYGNAKEQQVEYSEFGVYNATLLTVTAKGMALADGDQMVTCKIYDASGEEVSNAQDSINCYAQRGIEASSTSAEAKNLYNMIMRFTRSAYASFH